MGSHLWPALVPRQQGRARLAPWNPTASREEVRAYMQQRLALYSKLMFCIFWILVVFVLALYEVYPEYQPARVDIVHEFAFAGLIVLAAIWYVALHRKQCSIETLYRIDALYALLIGAAFGISAYFSSDQRPNVYSAFIWQTFAVFSRVIVLPSTGRRTAIIGALSFVPLVIAAPAIAINFPDRLDLPPLAFIGGTVMFAVVTIVLATTGSRVIFGLRRQVTAASQLGQYTLDDKIGEGGMGTVYRAHHVMLRRPTAIKLLPLDKYDAASLERFEREVQHTSMLTHPNTIAVFDYGRSPDGVFYYAMELIDGIDLETLVRRFGPQPPQRVIHILRQVCGALDEAHLSGLIHRDIKPANVLLCRRGRKPDVVKVVDFGLVTELAHVDRDTVRKIAGTPAYLAPEAITDPEAVGPHSDLYALGAVGYFLLTGVAVFEGADAVDVCVQHVTAPPPPPSSRTDNPIPAALEAVILRCLEKRPDARFTDALSLRFALGELVAYDTWDEAAALDWWNEYEAAGVLPGPDPDPWIRTLTVDLDSRMQSRVDASPSPRQSEVTGQLT